MASSTGLVVTAGAISLTDLAVTSWQPDTAIRITVATVLAALVSAGLDRVAPGLGTGAAAILLVAVLYRSGPTIAAHIK